MSHRVPHHCRLSRKASGVPFCESSSFSHSRELCELPAVVFRHCLVLVTAILLAFSASSAIRAGEAPPLAVEDLHRLAELSDPDFSPGGDSVAYAVSTHDLKRDKAVSDLWHVDWTSGAARPLTRTADRSESQPQHSRDGRWLAYLADGGKDEETQLWRMPARGGAGRQISRLPGGVSDYALSPDGRQAVVIAEVGRTVGSTADIPLPIVATRFQFKEDSRDYLDDRRQHLFIVDIPSGRARQLTRGDWDHWLPSWSPDGKWIAFVSKRTADADRNLDYDVFLIAPDGSTERRIGDFRGTDVDPYWESRPQWSPDSRKLVWLQSGEDKWIYYAPWQLAVADIETGAVTTPARIDRCFYKPRWSADGRHILALVEQDRDTWLAHIDPATGSIDYLTSGARFATDFAVAGDGRIAVLDGDNHMPAELSAVGEQPRPLTRHNAFLGERRLAETRDIGFPSDGLEIHGLLTLPLGYQPGKSYPTIVRLHGGPVYQFSHEFMADWQIYAANGYAVLAINPRGSSGRGFDFARAIYADWGNVDGRDIKAGIDHLIALGIADPERLGVGGWSYGGILTNYVIARDPRFKAAISGAGAGNMLGMFGTDQYAREYALELGLPWRDFETYRRVSYPFLHADRIRTPTMFQCAVKDFNVPCIGAEQMYQALQSEKLPSQLVIYPGENHGLSVPSYLADRMRRNLAWYDRWLKGESASPPP